MKQPSLGERLAAALVNLPNYLLSYVVGFIIVLIDDFDVFTLLLATVALGFILSPLWAVVAFLGTYVFLRVFNNLAGAIRMGLNDIAASNIQAAQISSPPRPLPGVPAPVQEQENA